MARVTYIQADGVEQTVEVDSGLSVMVGAVWNRVPGILAACGGKGGCATCQVYVDEAWLERTGQASSAERDTLRFAFERAASSRLACQIMVSNELDGLVVRLPRRQF